MTELQEHLLSILKLVDRLCKKHGVEYYLLGGSLIGAIRHKGFIPWDDDADVIMTRDNWEKFYYAVKDDLPEGYKISSQYDDIDVAMPINRLTETTSTGLFRYHLAAIETAGTQIDIFVMDPVPDTDEDREIYRTAIAEYSELSALHVTYAFRYGKGTNFITNWERAQEVGKRQVLEEISAKAFHYTEEESQLYAQRFGGAPHFWPKEVFGKPQNVPFEDTMLPIPARPWDCLVIGYDDDWRFVPRSGSDHSTHEFAVRSYTTPSEVIWNDYLDHANNDALHRAFVRRKYYWENQFDEKFAIDRDSQYFTLARIKLKYIKKLEGVDLKKLIADRDVEQLWNIFEEYVVFQTKNMMVGSASLTGRMQYYRRNHPLLIDIGDEALEAVFYMLLRMKKLGAAAKIMRARKYADRPLTPGLKQADDSIERIRRIVSTYGCNEFDECKTLTEQGLRSEPDNPFYIKYDIILRAMGDNDSDKRIDTLRSGLEQLPEEAELLYMLAETYKESKRESEAIKLYDLLIETTNDGLILIELKDRCKELYDKDNSDENYLRWLICRDKCGEDVRDLMPLPDEEDEPDETDTETINEEGIKETHNDVQKCRLNLIRELDTICRENNLTYYLYGNALWHAYKSGKYKDPAGDIGVLMSGKDALKFSEIVNNGNYRDRKVESMLNNPRFFRNCMRYCDTTTLDMALGRCDSMDFPCIGITIEILRPKETNTISARYRRLVEKGWEAYNNISRTGRKNEISRKYIETIFKLYGKSGAPKRIFRILTRGSNKKTIAKREKCFIKRYGKKRKYFDSQIFMDVAEVPFEDCSLMTAGATEELLESVFGISWETRRAPRTKYNIYNRQIDTELAYDEYKSYLAEEGIDTKDFEERWKTSNAHYRKITKISKLAMKHWYILEACGVRWNLFDQYKDKKAELMKTYNNRDIEAVGELIADYYRIARKYIKKRLIIYFDQDIFDVLLWYVREVHPDGERLSERLRYRQEKQKWTDLSLVNQEEES